MTDKTRACAASMVGAVIGAAVGYMFFTDRGRELRRQLEKTLEALEPELSHFSGTINQTASVASEGWKLLNEALGDSSRSPRYVNPHQTSPF